MQHLSIIKRDFGNNHHIQRYTKAIKYYIDNPVCGGELHHILPRSLYPKHIKDTKNTIMLPTRVHYIVHWMLAKGTNDNKMWFAFNMMNRVIQSTNKKSSLYRQAREYVKKAISESNTGRPHTEEQKRDLSKRMTNMVVVKDKDGNIKHVSVNDEKYKSGEYVYYRTGMKHKKSTIEKMVENNGIRDKIRYKNIETNEYGYFKESEILNREWIIDNSDMKSITKDRFVGSSFYHDPITKKHSRIKFGEHVPENLIKGRYFEKNKGFDVANSMINVVDLIERKCKKVFVVESHYAKGSATSTKQTKIITFNNKIFTSWTSLDKELKFCGVFIDDYAIKKYDGNYKVKKPHSRCTYKRNNFRKDNVGKGLTEFGIFVYMLEEFNYKEHKQKEISWN